MYFCGEINWCIMDRNTFEQQKAFAGSLKPSMLRRCLDHDYQGRCIYLITLVIEGRRPLFGELAGKSDGILGSDDEPRIILSPLGEEVQNLFYDIPKWHPEVQSIAIQMMPDHLHGILFVKEKMDRHLGQVISGFKAGCKKAYRHIILGEEVTCVVARHNIPNSCKQSLDNGRHGLLTIVIRGYCLPVAIMTGCYCRQDNSTDGSIIWLTIHAVYWPKGSILIYLECSLD